MARMNPPNGPNRPRRKDPRKISVYGTVPLGRELKLKQVHAPMEETRDGYQIRNIAGTRIDYRLAGSRDAVNIGLADDGLTNGYGIFGAPGTGKTHLLLHILQGVLAHDQSNSDAKFGGLILDPKGALLEDIAKLWKTLGPERAGDLIILKPDFLNYLSDERRRKKSKAPAGVAPGRFEHVMSAGQQLDGLNVIDCALSPAELGKMLVLAAQSAGVSATEPFWFMAWSNLFSAALTLIEYTEGAVCTISRLMNAVLSGGVDRVEVPVKINGQWTVRLGREIEGLALRVGRNLSGTARDASKRMGLTQEQVEADLQAAVAQIKSFYESQHLDTIEAFIHGAYGSFRQYKFRQLSAWPRHVSQKYAPRSASPSFYDRILEEGKVVLVSVGPEDPAMGKILCTLVKCLFQQSVMSRLERFDAGKLRNFERPVILACDEYAEVASEVPGQPMGDGRFFSLSRQNGCMGLLATQSIHTLENSSLNESWKSIFSNLAAKIFMGAADNETAEQASELAGQLDWEMNSRSESFGRDNSFSEQRSFQQRPELSPYVLTHVLQQGQAACIGSLDGRKTAPALRFFQVPEDPISQKSDAGASQQIGVGRVRP